MKVSREKELNKRINDKIILEMESSLGESEDVIRYIIEEATKEISSIKGDEPYKLNDYDLKKFAFGMIKQCTNFISTMDYKEYLNQAPQLSDDVKRDLEQILYTLKYASKSREQLPREVFIIDNDNIGKPDYMAYTGIKQHIQAQANVINEIKEVANEGDRRVYYTDTDRQRKIKQIIDKYEEETNEKS